MILFISIRDIFWRWIHIFSFLFFVVWPHRAARSEVARAWRATWFIQKYEYDPTISWCGVSVWAEYAIRESHRHPFRLRSSSKLNMGDGVIFACAVSHYRDEIPTDCLYSFFFISFFFSSVLWRRCRFISLRSMHEPSTCQVSALEIISLIRSSFIVSATVDCTVQGTHVVMRLWFSCFECIHFEAHAI